jgi:hypothetical protein
MTACNEARAGHTLLLAQADCAPVGLGDVSGALLFALLLTLIWRQR